MRFSSLLFLQVRDGKEREFEKVNFPVFGSIHSFSVYMMDVIIGWPNPQRQSLIIDTGSCVTGFGCHDCYKCGKHVDPLYDRSLSRTAIHSCSEGRMQCTQCTRGRNPNGHCMYTVNYMEGSSISGAFYKDYFWIGHSSERDTVGVPIVNDFGCHHRETNLFLTQKPSGIIGFEKKSRFGPKSFIENNLDELISIYKNIPLYGFAICISTEGGVISIGSANEEYHIHQNNNKDEEDYNSSIKQRFLYYLPDNENIRELQNRKDNTNYHHKNDKIQWVHSLYEESYHISMTSLSINDKELVFRHRDAEINGLLCLVDSGTTVSIFPRFIYNEIFIEITSHFVKSTDKRLLYLTNKKEKKQSLMKHYDEYKRNLKIKNNDMLLSLASLRKNINNILEFLIPIEDSDDLLSKYKSASKRSAHAEKFSSPYEECWIVDKKEDFNLFPQIKMKFEKSLFLWHPTSYLYNKKESNIYCLAFQPKHTHLVAKEIGDEIYVTGHEAILGTSFFINKDIIFDISTNEIGFIEAACPIRSFDDDRESNWDIYEKDDYLNKYKSTRS